MNQLVSRRTVLIFGVFIALIVTSAFLSRTTLSRGSSAARYGIAERVASGTASDAGLPQLPRPPARAFNSTARPIANVPTPPLTGILYVNPDGVCSGNFPCFTTIQAAIDAATAGGTINVAAATYAEQININKALALLGPNANVDPNTGSRGAEAIIIPTVSDPLNVSFGGPRVVTLAAAGITFDGFTIDGNNPSLMSGVVYNGQDVDAEFGIYGDGIADPDAIISNNIVKNIGEIAVWINTFGIGGTRNSNSRITNNKVDNNLGSFGQGIRISDDAWLDVTNNVVDRVRVGIVIENYSGNVTTHPASVISNNTVTSFRIGIRHNLHYVYSAPGFTISNNRVSPYVQSPIPPQVAAATAYQGIRVESIQQTVAVTVSDNVLTGNRTAMSAGGYTENEALMLTNASCTSPNIVFNLNNVSDFVRGVFNETPAVPTLTCNQIRGNTTGFYLSTNATNGLTANNNDIAGNGFGLQNDGAATVNAQSNWWGAASGPGPVGPGSGDQVSTNVDFSSFLISASACADHAPVVTTTAEAESSYTECDSPAVVDSGLIVTDSDNTTLSSGTVSITNNYQAGADVLAFTNSNVTEFGNIQVDSYSGGVLSLNSPGQTATVPQWQNALRAVTYSNTAANPSTSTRTVSFVANDGTNSSTAATQALSVIGVTTPTITPGGPTTFCTGGSVTLTSSAATGNQWYLNGNPIGGETNPQYIATAGGSYTVTTVCAVNASDPVVVTVNPIPPTPTITPGGPTTFCAGGSVTLTSSSASGNQWYLNGNPIGGATNPTYDATGSGSYTVVVTQLGCSSAPSASTNVTVQPSVLTVTNTNDSGSGSLRDAIANVCVGGTINFDPALNGQTITLTTGQLAINKNLTITGPGANLLTISGNNASRVLNTQADSTVTITDLTIANGRVTGSNNGGGVLNNGTLTLTNCNIYGNSNPTQTGGGIYTGGLPSNPNAASLTLNNCNIGGTAPGQPNTSGASGGGIFHNSGALLMTGGSIVGNSGDGIAIAGTATLNNVAITNNTISSSSGAGVLVLGTTGTATIVNCSIANNTVTGGSGGGIHSTGTANVVNSTISGNRSGSSGGGVNNFNGNLVLTNVTITNNRSGSGFGGGISLSGGVKLNNTIVAGNFRGASPSTTADDINGLVNASSSNNLIGVNTNLSGISNGSNGNQIGTSGAPINALLGILGANGGPTLTHALLPGSPAINAGDNAFITNPPFTGPPFTDQRGTGFARTVNGTVDIGAFESRGFSIAVTSGSGQSAVIATAFASPLVATVTSAFGEPVNGGQVTFTAPGSGAGATFAGGVTTINVATDASGQASASATANGTAGGPYNVTATGNGVTGTANFSLTNLKGNQTITFDALANKTFGDPDFAVSATASSALPVSFAASGNCTVTSPSPGTVHLTGAGSCTITASQAGDTNYNPATNVPQSFNIAKAATSTAVSSSSNPSDLNQSVTFTATVSSGAGTPAGTVQFKDNGGNLGVPVALNAGGVAQLTTSSLTAGTHTITAEYSGDADFLPSTGTLAGGQVVRAQPSLSINNVAIAEGNSGTQVLNFTATLSAASNLTVTATFNTANGIAIAPADYAATNGTATFNPGETTRTIPVTINGDVDFEADETFTVSLSNPINATISTAAGTATIQNDDALGGFIGFSQANTSVDENTGIVTLTVTRGAISFSQANTADALEAANVDYATDDTGASTNCAALNTGLASQRCDYTSVFGTLKFAPNETQKTIDIPITLDAYNEGPEVFTVKLSNPTGGAVAEPSTATVTINDSASPTPNAIDDTTNFVRQQYRDFLNREADAAGLAFWVDNIDKCNDPARRPANQTVAQCIEVQRIVTSAAFFLSIEFKQTGGLVRDFYVAALDRPATNNMPNYVEFMRDTQAIQKGVVVGQGNWQQVLDANRTAFMNEFVTRAEFVALYPTTDTPAQYVDKLYLHANVTPGTPQERLDAIAEFGGAATASDPGARGRALLRVTQNAAFQAREANRTFVQIEYFGYLRRNPNDAPDGNFNGYNFWVNKLNQFNGNFLDAEMVKAFLSSLEYRQRFGP